MHRYSLGPAVVALVVSLVGATSRYNNVDTINRSLRDDYCDQPLFITFLPKNDDTELLDNVCLTAFPLPDDPDTFQIYISRVFCDGSNEIISQIGTQIDIGVARYANPYITHTDSTFGYAGCDTYLVYRHFNFGKSDYLGLCSNFVYGKSPQCRTIGLSCLRKVDEIIKEKCLPDGDFYVLPMKLPNRCVTQQLCLQPPNPFYGYLPGASVI